MVYSLFALSYNKPDIQASLIAQLVKNWPAMQETHFDSWVRKIHWEKDRVPTPVFLGFPCGSAGERICLQCGKPGFYPWVGKIPLEKGKASHSSIPEWRIPWTEEPGGYLL